MNIKIDRYMAALFCLVCGGLLFIGILMIIEAAIA
jgi:hypothetical protein